MRNSTPARFLGPFRCSFDHRRTDVHTCHEARRADDLRQQECRPANAATQIEHFLSMRQILILCSLGAQVSNVLEFVEEVQKIDEVCRGVIWLGECSDLCQPLLSCLRNVRRR
jgi:hypothetical protein